EADFEGFGAFLEGRAGQGTLDEERKPTDIDERLPCHLDAQQLDGDGPQPRRGARRAILVGRQPLHGGRVAVVLDLDPLLPQRLYRAHDPTAPEAARSLDVGSIEERAVEREQAAGL